MADEGNDTQPGTQIHVQRAQSLPTKEVPEYLHKVFNDPIHGHIKLHTQLVQFIDTPMFQRLRSIRQTGGTYHVFPGASHNRFENSIGMCYLTGLLMKTITQNQKDLDIDINDELIVQIAALCRNLGYGPFSKVYHDVFLKLARPDDAPKVEDTTCLMFDYVVDYLVADPVSEIKDEDIDREAIKNIMRGSKSSTPNKKSFLNQIVCNPDTLIDVDMWDCLARDCRHVNIKTSFDHTRLIKFSRVIDVNGRGQLCYRDKESMNLYDMFHAQEIIRRRALQHKTVVSVEQMIAEALFAADSAPEIKIEGKDGVMLSLSQCVDDPVAFVKLDDAILNTILYTRGTSPELKKAQGLLGRIQTRKLYKYIGAVKPKKGERLRGSDAAEFETGIAKMEHCLLKREDIFVKIIKFDYTEEGKDPVQNAFFFTKHRPDVGRQIDKQQVSHNLPEDFRDSTIMVFLREWNETTYKVARSALRKWCNKHNKEVRMPPDMEDDSHQPTDA